MFRIMDYPRIQGFHRIVLTFIFSLGTKVSQRQTHSSITTRIDLIAGSIPGIGGCSSKSSIDDRISVGALHWSIADGPTVIISVVIVTVVVVTIVVTVIVTPKVSLG